MKSCNICNIAKPIEEFAIKRGKPSCSCRKCVSKRAMEYKRSRKGLTTKIYAHQRSHSKSRGHDMPTYTNSELYDWLISQSNFEELYTKWVASGYEQYIQPSINRLEDSKGYSFDNIELITWGANMSKGHAVNNKVNRTGVRRSDGKEYESLSDAGFDMYSSRGTIKKYCESGGTFKGFTFSYIS